MEDRTIELLNKKRYYGLLEDEYYELAQLLYELRLSILELVNY